MSKSTTKEQTKIETAGPEGIGALGALADLERMSGVPKSSDDADPRSAGADEDGDGADDRFDMTEDPDGESFGFEWEPKGGIMTPEPRPGMDQKWVRRALGGVNDVTHLAYQTGRAGWKPRRFETVPAEERRAFPMTSDLKYGEVITSGDLILCERPTAYGVKRREFYDKRRVRLDNVINEQIAAINESARPGIGNMHVAENRKRVSTRKPIVASDL